MILPTFSSSQYVLNVLSLGLAGFTRKLSVHTQGMDVTPVSHLAIPEAEATATFGLEP